MAILGALWFTALFGKAYTYGLGREGQPPFRMTPIVMVGPFVCGLITSIASAILMRSLEIDNFGDGLVYGLIVGIGFLVTTTVNTGINPNMPRPLLHDGVEGSDYALGALALAQMLDGRAADRERLQAVNDEMTATGMPIEGAKVSVESLGRSPLLTAILVVLGSGFFLLILVFVRQGLKGASQDPAAREKVERIRNSLLLRRNR